jgi:hypothetical protein
MPTYNGAAVSDAVIAFRKPITLQQGRAGMRDNLLAALEGSTGAPIVEAGWHPYDIASAGDGATGEIWSFATDGSATEIASPVFEDGFEYRFLCDNLGGGAGSTAISIEAYRQTSGAWSGVYEISASVGNPRNVIATITQPMTAAKAHIIDFVVSGSVSANAIGSVGGVLPCYVSHASSQKVNYIRFVGSFSTGAVYMQRRLTYR